MLSASDQVYKHSLLGYLDNTVTNYGKRLLREWLHTPSNQLDELNQRLDTVEWAIKNNHIVNEFREVLNVIAPFRC